MLLVWKGVMCMFGRWGKMCGICWCAFLLKCEKFVCEKTVLSLSKTQRCPSKTIGLWDNRISIMKWFFNVADFLTESTPRNSKNYINFSKTFFLYLFFLQNIHSLFNIVFFFQNCASIRSTIIFICIKQINLFLQVLDVQYLEC